MANSELIDCLIVGAGPAGLTAGLNLVRFFRTVRVIDAGCSRASLIPLSHNYPGFPDGINGNDLLARLRRQLTANGGAVTHGAVRRLARTAEGEFVADTDEETIRAKTVLLATGTVDIQPELAGFQELKDKGCVRFCPVCDGFEFAGKRIGVIASNDYGADECLFIKRFSDHLCFIGIGGDGSLDASLIERLERKRIDVLQGHVRRVFAGSGDIVHVEMAGGDDYAFDVLYCALGSRVRSDLAGMLGARRDAHNYLVVDAHQQTGVEGLYAAGDVTSSLSQLTVAAGQAAIAAVAIHNRLPG